MRRGTVRIDRRVAASGAMLSACGSPAASRSRVDGAPCGVAWPRGCALSPSASRFRAVARPPLAHRHASLLPRAGRVAVPELEEADELGSDRPAADCAPWPVQGDCGYSRAVQKAPRRKSVYFPRGVRGKEGLAILDAWTVDLLVEKGVVGGERGEIEDWLRSKSDAEGRTGPARPRCPRGRGWRRCPRARAGRRRASGAA